MKYIKKPIAIEAEQWYPDQPYDYETDGINGIPMRHWKNGVYDNPLSPTGYTIETLEREVSVSPGDYILTGIEGERYPCKSHIFMKTYEPVED